MFKINRKLIYFAGVIIVAVLFLFYISNKKPASDQISKFVLPTPIQSQKNIKTPGNLSINIELPDVPEVSALPVLNITVHSGWEDILAGNIGFTNPPEVIGSIKVWKANGNLLTVNSESLEINYTNSKAQSLIWTEENLQSFAKSEVIKLFPNLEFTEPKTFSLVAEDEGLTSLSPFTSSNSYILSFTPRYLNYPIFTDSIIDPISAKFGFFENVISYQIEGYQLDFDPTDKINIISPRDSFEKIKRDQGAVIYLTNPDDLGLNVFPIFDPKSATIENYSLGYYLPPNKKGQLFPYYKFIGNTPVPDHGSFEIAILIPAF